MEEGSKLFHNNNNKVSKHKMFMAEGSLLELDERTLGAVEGVTDGTMEGISDCFLVDFVFSPALGLFVASLGYFVPFPDLEFFNLRSEGMHLSTSPHPQVFVPSQTL